jgi:hypothetical protein
MDLGRSFRARVSAGGDLRCRQAPTMDKERGGLTEGLAADPMATPEDPVKDIMTLRKVDFVMKGVASSKDAHGH